MGFQKGHTKEGGQKKLGQQKITAVAKEVIAAIATELGGKDRMLEWVRLIRKTSEFSRVPCDRNRCRCKSRGRTKAAILVVCWKESGE
jgi:hypothetical protein